MSITEKYLFKKVRFISGNFAGEKGTCVKVDGLCNDEGAMFGLRLDFELEDGRKVRAYKSEHFELDSTHHIQPGTQQ